MSLPLQAIKGAAYVAINNYFQMAVSLATGVVLARILLPESFGIIALATFFLGIVSAINQFGFDYALVHKQNDVPRTAEVHLFLQFISGLVVVILVIILIPILSHFYNSDISKALVGLAFNAILQIASATPKTLLEKELQFKKIMVINVSGIILSSIISVYLAVHGVGYLSLVALQVVMSCVNLVGYWYSLGYLIKPKFDKNIVIWFFKFGTFLWVGAFSVFTFLNFNNYVIGTILGTTVLGFYSKAFSFSQLPTAVATAVISRVATPLYAKVQNDLDRLTKSFNLALEMISIISFPLVVVLFLLSSDLIQLLLTDKWLPMVPLFKGLLIYSYLRSLHDDTGGFLTSIGRPKAMTKFLVVEALTLLILSPIMIVQFGVMGAVIAIDIAITIGIVISYLTISRIIKVDYKNAIIMPVLSGLIAGSGFLLISPYLNGFGLSVFSLIFKGIIIGALYLLISAVLQKEHLLESWKYLRKTMLKGEDNEVELKAMVS